MMHKLSTLTPVCNTSFTSRNKVLYFSLKRACHQSVQFIWDFITFYFIEMHYDII